MGIEANSLGVEIEKTLGSLAQCIKLGAHHVHRVVHGRSRGMGSVTGLVNTGRMIAGCRGQDCEFGLVGSVLKLTKGGEVQVRDVGGISGAPADSREIDAVSGGCS